MVPPPPASYSGLALRTAADLRFYQPPCIDFIVRKPQCAAFLRPGLGKTIITLMALVKIGCRRTLVVAPSQVVESEVWSLEAVAWAETAHLRVVELHGSPKERWLKMVLGADILVVSYDLLRELTDRFTDRRLVLNNYFDAIIYDELSKMKHPGTKRFKRMRHWAQRIEVRPGLTGSPLGNHWQDIWGEMRVTAGNIGLGATHEDFLATYFNAQVRPGIKVPIYQLRPDGSADAIRGLVKPHAFSLPAAVTRKVLPPIVRTALRVKVPAACRAMEAELREKMEVELASGATLYALTQSKLGQLIRQFSSGAVYTNEDRTEYEVLHDEKLRALQDRVDELQGEPVLVYAWFRHSKDRILRRFKGFEALTGKAAQVARWNRKEIPGLVLNAMGSGMGLNLQHGGADVFWFDPEWALWALDQGDGRLARLGQPEPLVSSTVCLAGAIDTRIWDRLLEKGADEESLIEAVSLDLPDFY